MANPAVEGNSAGGQLQAAAHALLKTDRYNKDVLPELIKCVHAQVEQGWYDSDINLAILKLYQFHPDAKQGVVELDIMVKILALAMMRLPSADFKLCLFLIPDQYQGIDSVSALTKLAEKLEVCQYAAFWDLLGKKQEVLALVPGLDTSLRRSIFDAVALTYQELPCKLLSEFLNLPADQLVESYGSLGLKIDGDKALMPSSIDNQPRPAVVEESAQLPQLAQVLANTMF